jgi:ABC-2 type transport system permease protein
MKRFLIFTKAMFLMNLRSREVLFWNFAFPVFLLLIFGTIERTYINWMTPGLIVLNALSFGLMGSSSMMVELRDKGILRRLRATPLPAAQLLGAYLLVNLLLVLCQSGLILGTAVLLFGQTVSAAALALSLPMVLAGGLTFLALGQLVGGLAPRAGAATAMGMTLYFGMMFISDLIFPIAQLPAWLQNVVPYLPSTLVAGLVRPALLSAELDPQWLPHLGLLAVYAVAASVLIAQVFRWEPKA